MTIEPERIPVNLKKTILTIALAVVSAHSAASAFTDLEKTTAKTCLDYDVLVALSGISNNFSRNFGYFEGAKRPPIMHVQTMFDRFMGKPEVFAKENFRSYIGNYGLVRSMSVDVTGKDFVVKPAILQPNNLGVEYHFNASDDPDGSLRRMRYLTPYLFVCRCVDMEKGVFEFRDCLTVKMLLDKVNKEFDAAVEAYASNGPVTPYLARYQSYLINGVNLSMAMRPSMKEACERDVEHCLHAYQRFCEDTYSQELYGEVSQEKAGAIERRLVELNLNGPVRRR